MEELYNIFMPIEVRKEIMGFGFPLGRRRVLEKGEQVVTKAPFPLRGREIVLTALTGDKLRLEVINKETKVFHVTREQLRDGLVFPGKHGTRISVRVAKEKKHAIR